MLKLLFWNNTISWGMTHFQGKRTDTKTAFQTFYRWKCRRSECGRLVRKPVARCCIVLPLERKRNVMRIFFWNAVSWANNVLVLWGRSSNPSWNGVLVLRKWLIFSAAGMCGEFVSCGEWVFSARVNGCLSAAVNLSFSAWGIKFISERKAVSVFRRMKI